MKKYLFLFSIFVSLVSCRSFDLQQLQSGETEHPVLPKLKVTFDKESFIDAKDYPVVNNVQYNFADSGEIFVHQRRPQYTRLDYDREAVYFAQNFIYDHICSRYGKEIGKIKLTRYYKQEDYFGSFFFLSICSFGALNLLGMPVSITKYSLGMNADIFDKDNQAIAHYSAYVTVKVPVAMYYGYSSRGAIPKSKFEAYTLVLKKLQTQIDQDKEQILKRLN